MKVKRQDGTVSMVTLLRQLSSDQMVEVQPLLGHWSLLLHFTMSGITWGLRRVL